MDEKVLTSWILVIWARGNINKPLLGKAPPLNEHYLGLKLSQTLKLSFKAYLRAFKVHLKVSFTLSSILKVSLKL